MSQSARENAGAAHAASARSVAASEPEARALLAKAGALAEGHFLLSSGLHSSQYFQCARLLESPPVAEQIARALAPLCADWDAQVVLSPALGAVLWGYELARALHLPNIYAERPGGKFELRRGFQLKPGDRVLLAENVVTTGGSVLETAEMARAMGAVVAGYAAIVDRSGGSFQPPEPVATYTRLAGQTYMPEDCPLCRDKVPLIKPGSRSFS